MPPCRGGQHLRGQEMSLRDTAARLVIATGKKKGQLGRSRGWDLTARPTASPAPTGLPSLS